MKFTTSSLGFELTFDGPSTPEEYDQLFGRPGACLNDAMRYRLSQGPLAVWREAFCRRLEIETRIPRGSLRADVYIQALRHRLGLSEIEFMQKYRQMAAEVAAGISVTAKGKPSNRVSKAERLKQIEKMIEDLSKWL